MLQVQLELADAGGEVVLLEHFGAALLTTRELNSKRRARQSTRNRLSFSRLSDEDVRFRRSERRPGWVVPQWLNQTKTPRVTAHAGTRGPTK